MQDGALRTRRWALVLAAAVCALAVTGGAPASDGVFWQGQTPENRTAVVAAVGSELRIPLEAAGPIGTQVSIFADRLPAGGRLERSPENPSQATFRWRPAKQQLGEWKLRFGAEVGTASAPRITVYVHVGRRLARTFRISSENGLSWNAVLARSVNALSRPAAGSRAVKRLTALTPEGVRHVVYLLGGTVGRDGRYWLRVALPKLPNGSSGWIPREAVTDIRKVDTHLVIDRSRLRATLYRNGRPVFRSIVGVGQPQWPTPRGRFYVRERLTGFTDPIYGSLAFGTNGRSAVLTDWPGGGFIGIHGTNQPEILPGRVSHGCVRMPNESIRRLDRLMRVGTPVTIN
ncbi:MAG TPA: L,D-transpeptidase [Gaiellaceae bacterium]|nr:L,D-transpeptidase [Gaiellaceae bacterium]